MAEVQIRNLTVGDKIPKICVPIVGSTMEEIVGETAAIMNPDNIPDIIEFRADWYRDAGQEKSVLDMLQIIRNMIADIPLLFAFRTAKEGGEKSIQFDEYEKLLVAVAKSGLADAVDVEMFSFAEDVDNLIEKLHQFKVVVVGSNHDFVKTPESDEMTRRLLYMKEHQADIAKIAVMPENSEDVLRLLSVTAKLKEEESMCPIITMAMGSEGVISRMSGELFGSAVTFASVRKASAPGQINIRQLRHIMETIHSCM